MSMFRSLHFKSFSQFRFSNVLICQLSYSTHADTTCASTFLALYLHKHNTTDHGKDLIWTVVVCLSDNKGFFFCLLVMTQPLLTSRNAVLNDIADIH